MTKTSITNIIKLLFSLTFASLFQYYAISTGIDSVGWGFPISYSSGYIGYEQYSFNAGALAVDLLFSTVICYFLLTFLLNGFNYLYYYIQCPIKDLSKYSPFCVPKDLNKDISLFSLCLILSIGCQFSLSKLYLFLLGNLPRGFDHQQLIYAIVPGWPTPIFRYSESGIGSLQAGLLILNMLFCLALFCFLFIFIIAWLATQKGAMKKESWSSTTINRQQQ